MCLRLGGMSSDRSYIITDCIIWRLKSIDELSKLRSTIDNNNRSGIKYTEFEDIAKRSGNNDLMVTRIVEIGSVFGIQKLSRITERSRLRDLG